MVRAWHFDVIPLLDDERLTANHSEAHMMMRSLKRAGGGWFSHPETQTFYWHPQWLAWLHDLTVEEMARRGYPSGHDHKTPAEYKADSVGIYTTYEPGFPSYKDTLYDWLVRDYADLYAKWEKERRWDEEGYSRLGRRVACNSVCYVGDLECEKKSRKGRHVPTSQKWQLDSGLKLYTHRDFLLKFHEKVGPRELVPYDSEGLRKLSAERRTFTGYLDK